MTSQDVQTPDEVREQIEGDESLRGELAALPEVTSEPTAASEPEESNAQADDARGYHPYYGVEDNDCGQAAIAGVLDYWDVNLGNMGPGPWPNDRAVAQVKADGFGPNVPFQGWGRFGTNGDQIAAAFNRYGGKQVGIGFAATGPFARPTPDECFQTLKSWVGAGWPIPVLVQANYVMPVPGGPWPPGIYGHWPVVTAIDGQNVWLSNVSPGNDPIRVSHNGFMSAWNYLGGAVHGYHHAFVVGHR